MIGDDDKAGRYRDRAEQLRTMASDTRDRGAKSNLLDMADEYERLARTFGSSAKLPEFPGMIPAALPVGGAKK